MEKYVTELQSIQGYLNSVDESSDTFDSAEFDQKVARAEELQGLIEKANERRKKIEEVNQMANSFEPAPVKQSVANVQVKEGFEKDPKKGFQSGGQFLKAIYDCGNKFDQDHRLAHIMQTAGTHNTISDGLMIPSEYADGLLLNESGINDDWMSRMIVEPTSSNSKTFKRSASNTLGGSVGITASRIAENTQMSSTKEVFETTTLPLAKLYAYSEVTEEDMEDIPWLEGHLRMQAPKVIRKEFAGEVLGGSGTGKALGMFNANNANKIQVTRNTASDVKAADLANMYARHIRGAGSFWVINQDTLAKIPLITVGDDIVTWTSFFQDGQVGSLMGIPVYLSEHCSALGSAGDVRLINPNGYRILEKVGGSKFASSMHVKFDYDLMAFRWTHRINGLPWCNDVYTPTNGSTLSPFVELGTA